MQHNELVTRLLQLEEEVRKWRAERDDETFRKDMQKDGKIDEQPISKEMAIQIIKQYEMNYDAQSVANIEQQRKDDPTHKRVTTYDKATKFVNNLKQRYNL